MSGTIDSTMATTLPTLGNEVAPNTERNTESIPLLNSDSEAGRGVGEPKPMFEVSSVLKKASYTKSDNLAAVLMTRLKAIMPPDHSFKGLIERQMKEDFGV